MQRNFFSEAGGATVLAPGATLLHNFLGTAAAEFMNEIEGIAARAPFRNMVTPGGFRMSVAMTSCGACGWITDRKGYRYSTVDPESGKPWPLMPELFGQAALAAAEAAGYSGFCPDACLINRYEPGARMTLHQDKDEKDMEAPIVSVSLGLPATFQFGGLTRKQHPEKYVLESGDVVVWGGPSRLNYHGVLALRDGHHPVTGAYRYNLTFRKTE